MKTDLLTMMELMARVEQYLNEMKVVILRIMDGVKNE